MAIVIPILTEYSNRGMQQAYRDIKKSEDKFSAFGKVASTALLGAAAAAGAFAVKLGVDAVKAAADDQQSLESLGKTLDNLHAGGAQKGVEDFISALQKETGVADTELRPAFERLVRSTKSVAEAQKAVRIAVDAAAGSTASLTAISNAMGKAYDGNTASLVKLGLGLDKATVLSGDMTKITGAMAQVFGGQAKTQAATLTGQINLLKVSFDEASEAVGYSLVRAFGRVTGNAGIGGFQDAIESTSTYIADLVDGSSILIEQLKTKLPNAASKSNTWFQTLAGEGLARLGDAVMHILDPTRGLRDAIAGVGQAAAANQKALDAASSRYQGLADSAWNAANSVAAANAVMGRQATASRYTALAVQEYGKSVSYTGGTLSKYIANLHAANTAATGSSSGGSGSSSGGTVGATKAQTAALDKMNASLDVTTTRLGKVADDLDAAKTALADYTSTFSSWLTGSVSLSDAMQAAADTSGTDAAVTWMQAFTQQIADGRNAVAVLNALKATLDPANTAGNQLLIGQLLTLPPAQAAAAAQTMIDQGLGPALATSLADYDVFAGAAGAAWADTFYGSGVTAAENQYAAIKATLEGKLDAFYQLGKTMGDAVAAGFQDAIKGLPVGVKIPGKGTSTSTTTYSSPVTVNVNAGVGDPIAIARTIETVLRTSRTRKGTAL